jgi:hypothetical protein
VRDQLLQLLHGLIKTAFRDYPGTWKDSQKINILPLKNKVEFEELNERCMCGGRIASSSQKL